MNQSSATGCRLQILTDPNQLHEIAAEWDGLASLAMSPFLTAAWLEAWWRAFGRVTCLVLRDVKGGLRAGACVRPLRGGRLHAAAGVNSDVWNVVACSQEFRRQLWDHVALLRAGHLHLVRLPAGCDGTEPAVTALREHHYGVHTTSSVSSPWLPLPASFSELLNSLSRSMRSQVSRRHRSLNRQGRVVLRTVRSGPDLPTQLAAFFALEASGWKGRAGTAILSSPRTHALYLDYAMAAAAGGHLSVQFLELDGTPIAADINCTYGGHRFLLKTAYDEAYASSSPGLVLREEILRDAVESGCRAYHFLGGPDSYKLRWGSHLRRVTTIDAYRGWWTPVRIYPGHVRPMLKRAHGLKRALATPPSVRAT